MILPDCDLFPYAAIRGGIVQRLGREAGDLAGTYRALLSPKTQGPARPSSLLGSLACGLSFPLKEILNLSDSLFPCLPSSSHASSNRVDRCSHFRRQLGLTHSRPKKHAVTRID